MNRLKKIIIVSLIITVPISIYSIIWVNNTVSLYNQFGRLYTASPHKLYTAGLIEFKNLQNRIRNNLGLSKKGDVNILIKKKYIEELMSNVPRSARQHKKAIFYINNEVFKGKVKLRGDNYYHWLFPQKSWRFKFSKKDLATDIHKLNLIIPKGYEILNNHLAYKLAKKLDLLAPDSELVTLSINSIPNGIKIMAEQIDESFLRKNGRMPNDIYKGDNIGSKKILGASVNLFNTPSIWEKTSYNNHYEKSSRKPLEELLLNHNKTLLDIDSFARFSAYIDLINTEHYDISHNWILYYDNYFEKIYPIIWDPLGWWEVQGNKINIISSELLENLHQDYQFLYKKYKVMHSFFRDKKDFMKTIDREIEVAKSKILDSDYTFRLDRRRIMSHREALKRVEIFKARILTRFSKVENFFLGRAKKDDYAFSIDRNKIRLSIKGHKMIKNIIIKVKGSNELKEVGISYFIDGKEIKRSLKNKTTINPDGLIINQTLLAKALISNTLTFQEATYDIELEGLDVSTITGVSLEFLNPKNQVVSVNKVKYLIAKEFNKVYNIVKKNINLTPEIWSGIKVFSGFNIIQKNIIIKPGTKIVLEENASLKILGKVTAIGTKEKPIIFEAKDKTKPWNTLALKDARADGSVFKYCIFKDGSGDKGDLYEYTAMFSVHNVKDLLVENCEFYDSHKTDDMVHVIYSDATFKNTKFVRSLSDALDVDISNLIVDHCEFLDSGNDAIDLMTTNAIVTNTKFTRSADKGISIGEGSNLLAINNYIKRNEIGIQSKDTSKAYIYHSSFVENKKAVDAYHKNWRYSKGGTIFIDKSIFKNNIENASVGKKSKIVINNSDIDTPGQFDKKNIRKKKIVISDDDFLMYQFDEAFFNNRDLLIQKQIKGYHE